MRRTWLLGLFLGLAVDEATAAERWRIAPPPTWVAPVERPEAPAKDDAAGIRYLLMDHQIQVASSGTSQYWRYARKVVTSSGLDQAAEIRVAFDPAYQELVFHHVEVIRDGRSVGTFGRGDVRILQQEPERLAEQAVILNEQDEGTRAHGSSRPAAPASVVKAPSRSRSSASTWRRSSDA